MAQSPALAAREVRIASDGIWLTGDLSVPPEATGLVLFAHGTGSGRHSARNRMVASHLQQAGIATLLPDMLTQQEQGGPYSREHHMDVALLTRRMQDATAWAMEQPSLRQLPLGYFGASTGSAAALIAAARLGGQVAAVVSRGGRPDLAGHAVLAAIKASTLLIVGAADEAVLDLNERAYQQLRCERSLAVVPGAGHLFEEPGALEQVAEMAASWFHAHMVAVETA